MFPVTGDTGEVYFDIAFNPLLREDILIRLLPAHTTHRLSENNLEYDFVLINEFGEQYFLYGDYYSPLTK